MFRILADDDNDDDDEAVAPALADISNEVGGNRVVVAAAEVEKSASFGILK